MSPWILLKKKEVGNYRAALINVTRSEKYPVCPRKNSFLFVHHWLSFSAIGIVFVSRILYGISASGKSISYCMLFWRILYLVALLGLGLLISTYSGIYTAAGNVGWLYSSWWFSFLWAGYSHLIDSMPDWAPSGRLLNPLTLFHRSHADGNVKKGGFQDYRPDIFWSWWALPIFFNTWAVLNIIRHSVNPTYLWFIDFLIGSNKSSACFQYLA